MTFNDLSLCVRKCRLPSSCYVMVPSPKDHTTFPPKGYVAISPQHLEYGLRFPILPYLVDLLYDLKLSPCQLTPNSYAQLTSLTIFFIKEGYSPFSPKIIKSLYSFKSVKDGLYYVRARPSDFKGLLSQGKAKGKSNVGDYKTHWFFISCSFLFSL